MSMALSPVEAFARPRTQLRWLDAATVLEQFALVTFDVDPASLAVALPAGLEPEVRTLDGGRARGFVSAVSFRDVDFRFTLAPWLQVSFFQTNYRAYVRGPDGRQAVHFFGTTLDSPLVAMPRVLWGMPWHPGRTSITSSWSEAGVCESYRHVCSGRWGEADVELLGSDEPLGRLDGFVDAEDAAHVLTHSVGRLVRATGWPSWSVRGVASTDGGADRLSASRVVRRVREPGTGRTRFTPALRAADQIGRVRRPAAAANGISGR